MTPVSWLMLTLGSAFSCCFFFKWKQIVSERGKFRPWSGMAVAPSLPTVSSGGPRWCSRGLWVPEVGWGRRWVQCTSLGEGSLQSGGP